MKQWWSGNPAVEPFMPPVRDAIARHLPDGAAQVDIYNRAYEAVHAALQSLDSPHPDWTPCAEGLPKKDGAYDVTVKSAFGKLMLLPGYFRNGTWWNCPYSEHIIAWKPKPAPYNPDRKEDAKADDVSQWPEWKQRAALSNYKFENADHIVDANKKVDQVCPVCNSMAHYDPHFGRVMCRQCGWMQEDSNG